MLGTGVLVGFGVGRCYAEQSKGQSQHRQEILTKRLRDKLITGRTTRVRRQGRRQNSHSSKDQTHVFGCVGTVTDLHNRSERGSQRT